MIINFTQTTLRAGLLALILALGVPSHAQSYTHTFDWENAVSHGSYATQTVAGVKATVTTTVRQDVGNFSEEVYVLPFFNGASGANGNAVFTSAPNINTSLTVTFNKPVDIASFFAFDADRIWGQTWTFTPAGGNNNPHVQRIENDNGSLLTVNWTAVSSFTITSAFEKGLDAFGLDDINFTPSLATDIDPAYEGNPFKVYPNPASNYISVSGVKENTIYQIINVLGKEVSNGSVSSDRKIDIRHLTDGIYLIKLKDRGVLRFIKK
ncbi:Por secretion system C-terminal sorting domain-containing protein [Saccharicrinis carchari]|uniref:Por secretion system C-terminal sorting domain-containing protein n=1 Tax=Saccharicrinis carchari TaxID=1168039 RepID=A0A521CZD0_SACCC|nr:T9SS type A sorting domain-containing protein [Saccharicrinis carchari]SMO64809.1 Por secretion system C-terminal sorting domain-containing protein [Saccharicrinis carchari]